MSVTEERIEVGGERECGDDILDEVIKDQRDKCKERRNYGFRY